MRSSWVNDSQAKLILAAMMPANRLALEVSDATGLRIDDVLSLRTDVIRKSARPYVTDSKTGKRHRIYVPVELRSRLLEQSGDVYVFPGRVKPKTQHRTRQAVYKDMMQAVAVFRRSKYIEQSISASPHTMRKRAAVKAFQKGGIDAAAALLNHSGNDAAVTLLYALSDRTATGGVKRGRSAKHAL